MRELLEGVRRRGRRIWNYRRIEKALRGQRGLEIGGPSGVFSPATPNGFVPPVYAIAASVDNCNFAANTRWSQGEAGRTFRYMDGRELGMQYIHDATDLHAIPDGAYDFVLASHILEHVANPLRALREFRRVLRRRGHLLILVPNRLYSFDHRRPVTAFAHLEADLAADRSEDDTTHLEEILALHDLERDPGAGTAEEFHARCLKNSELRCMHHHVFDLALLDTALRYKGYRPIYETENWGLNLLAFASRD